MLGCWGPMLSTMVSPVNGAGAHQVTQVVQSEFLYLSHGSLTPFGLRRSMSSKLKVYCTSSYPRG